LEKSVFCVDVSEKATLSQGEPIAHEPVIKSAAPNKRFIELAR
jgi:hypothetical protein